MIIACIILSSLAFLAAVITLTLFLVEKKREMRRRTAMLDYIANECAGVLEAAEETAREYSGASIKEYNESSKVLLDNVIGNLMSEIEQLKSSIEQLKSGAVPDYEKAVAAANAVNEFNAGISSILSFDPIAVARSKRTSGEKEVAN